MRPIHWLSMFVSVTALASLASIVTGQATECKGVEMNQSAVEECLSWDDCSSEGPPVPCCQLRMGALNWKICPNLSQTETDLIQSAGVKKWYQEQEGYCSGEDNCVLDPWRQSDEFEWDRPCEECEEE